MTKDITIKTAGTTVQTAVETLLPEHHMLTIHTTDTTRPWVEFAGFIDEAQADAIQATITIPEITIKQFTYHEGNTRIFYSLSTPSTDTLGEFKSHGEELLQAAKIAQDSSTFFQDFLGKKGKFNDLAKLMKNVAPESRADAGKLLNDLKQSLTEISLKRSHDQTISRSDVSQDPSLPGILPPVGHLHLISEAIDEVESIFASLGFIRRRYPEIESDWYYAEGLNIPKDHPARDDQETFYFSDSVVLTAHTSNGQLREMEFLKDPPIKMINIGKTYRRQATNTHSPMFHQFEGLVVDKGINIAHLVGISNYFAKKYFGPDREIRLRPHHFQFTEPSFEVDINCHICKGTGEVDGHRCKVCKGGWLELGGAGMVHPTVLKNGGIDPSEYSGFAFGWGIERIIMMKHEVTDNLRTLYTDDLRFLTQS